MSVLWRIKPVRYKWNGLWGRTNDGEDQVGIIGQELEAVAPYAVLRSKDKLHPEGHETEIIQVNAAPIIFLLVNAIKDLEAQIDELSKQRRFGA
jgi:hypothetical protein